MADFGLKVAIADTVHDLLGDVVEQNKANASAISRDGHVYAGALPSLGWFAYDGQVPGAIAAGSNQMRWPFPQGGVIRRVSFDVRTAPTGGRLVFTVTGGNGSESFSLQSGQTTATVATRIVMPPGSWARINVTSAGGANDLAIILHYTPGVN